MWRLLWNPGPAQQLSEPQVKGQNLATKLVVALLNIIYITTYFENLTVELHVLYALTMHVKFCVNDIIYYMIYKIIFCA